jgi:hypothetical protein
LGQRSGGFGPVMPMNLRRMRESVRKSVNSS